MDNPIRRNAPVLACMAVLILALLAWSSGSTAQGPEFSGAEKMDQDAFSRPTRVFALRLPQGRAPLALADRHGLEFIGPVGPLQGFYLFRVPADRTRVFDAKPLKAASEILWFEQQHERPRFKRLLPTDPLFPDQWHLRNIAQSGGTAGVDVNVLPVWDRGIFGSGVQIAVVDDGLDHAHPDLADNYIAANSWNYNDDNPDPSPTTSYDDHGTAVAGVAAARDEGLACGVGVAYRASLAGLRLIAGWVTDAMEAQALTHDYHDNHVFNNSWGPNDDGRTLEGPGKLTLLALEDGTRNGRGGLGSIYVWAGGNGQTAGDNVNYDGYANSRHTIAVGAVDHDGRQADYSEPGAALLVVAPSSGSSAAITTTDILGWADPNDACRSDFSGTSAAAPLVSGVVALMLEVNPNLSWRDVQHVLVRSATRNDPTDSDWVQNGAGKWVSHKYGFGMVNAAQAVEVSGSWSATDQAMVRDSGLIAVNLVIPDNDAQGVEASFVETRDMQLEHVEVVFSATHPRRGDLEIVLTSPDGTRSVLAETRNDYNANYPAWMFMSVRHWGESSKGTWTLRVVDKKSSSAGTFDSWRLILHGTNTRSPAALPGVLMLLLGDE